MTTTGNPPSWPRHDAVCVDCRTLAFAGKPCDGGPKHRVRALANAAEREELLAEVWGPPSRRRQMKNLSKAGAGGAGGASAIEACGGADCGGCDVASGCEGAGGGGEALAIIAAIVVIAFAIVALYWLISKLIAYIRKRRQILKANGALKKPARPGRRTGMVGLVEDCPTLGSPISGAACVGYATSLATKSGPWGAEATMLRDAATIGFTVQLDDGRRVQVPAGPMVLDMRNAEQVSAPAGAVGRYLTAIDPTATGDDLLPFPYDKVRERLLRPGDRVEIIGPVEATVDVSAAPTGYRDAAATVLTPAGVPRLRLAAT